MGSDEVRDYIGDIGIMEKMETTRMEIYIYIHIRVI